MPEKVGRGEYEEGCLYCGECSCQEHFRREPEEKVAVLLVSLLAAGRDYYADTLEGAGYGPDWNGEIGDVEFSDGGHIEVMIDGERIAVEVWKVRASG